ncbi:copper resistance protein NlpE [uncultured Alistipes sp.]|uniref:copper resistance protein NlpE n=1 Tax=uncultured Alistipes sp. TaxID=538949 RepID=UPI0026DF11BE|nr:copper resistance protein NlpE [uncultured Alistipes sp.]
MKRRRIWMWGAAALLLVACGGNASRKDSAAAEPVQAGAVVDTHNAENALDYCGTYRGTIPAADCPGIELTLTLQADGRFEQTWNYLEREGIFTERGPYKVEGNLLTLRPDGDGVPLYYKVEENRLRKLDASRRPIEGELASYYVLQKIAK